MTVSSLPSVVIDYSDGESGAVYLVSPRQLFETEGKRTLVAKIFKHRRSIALYPNGEGGKVVFKLRRKSMTDIDVIFKKIPQTRFLMKHLKHLKTTTGAHPQEVILCFSTPIMPVSMGRPSARQDG